MSDDYGRSSVVYCKGMTVSDARGPLAGMGVYFDADHYRAASYQWSDRGLVAEQSLRAEIMAIVGALSRLLKGYPGHRIIVITDSYEVQRVVTNEIRFRSIRPLSPLSRDREIYRELRHELDDRTVEVRVATDDPRDRAGMTRARTQASAAIEVAHR